MRICPKCGYRENPNWRHSRFDFNADYMRFEEAFQDPELKDVCMQLQNKKTYVPIEIGDYIYYRRGTGGIYLYRVPNEDFKVPRERRFHRLAVMVDPNQRKLLENKTRP